MKHFNLLEEKRKHVKKYSAKVPDKELIEQALWKAWKTSPSKNNMMAYSVHVWGPHLKEEKIAIHSLCVKAHKRAEDRAVEDVKMPEIQKTQGGVPNPYYEHIKLNPYLLTIHSRVVPKANRFYAQKIKEGHFADQMYEDYVERIVDSVAVEVGIFAANLTNYLLEVGLDMSYNSCFKRRVKDWHNVGLDMITHRPILMMTIGYGERYRRQDLKDWGKETWDIKPPARDVIKWI